MNVIIVERIAELDRMIKQKEELLKSVSNRNRYRRLNSDISILEDLKKLNQALYYQNPNLYNLNTLQ